MIQTFRVNILKCLVRQRNEFVMLTTQKLLFLKCMYLQFAHLELRIQWWNCVIQTFRVNILKCLVRQRNEFVMLILFCARNCYRVWTAKKEQRL